MARWRSRMLQDSIIDGDVNVAVAVYKTEQRLLEIQHLYRTGYADGWIAGVGAMFERMQVGAGGQEAHAACYDHWEKHLTEWANSRDTIATLPQSME